MTTTTTSAPPEIAEALQRWRACWHSPHHLAVAHGPDAGWVMPLHVGDRVTIGRGDAADLRLADPLLREVHAVAMLTHSGLRLERGRDEDTRLLLAGRKRRSLDRRRARRPRTWRRLRAGDAFRIGGSTLVLRPPHIRRRRITR